ncbi:sensor histidine kinase [Crocosphaera sp. UHCC 0190]|uniref:sensor histidine kinase n=1 Tax=Crocosphaera sp. UHCC 0190 TaxID=3110246 RepID=UPI002B20B2D6|nr:sensor histidine kinase [Crocosphaera sp. UHCC 0190]MEA5508268.1 sensor histidine kinase [Crocosphaera sp. UHCC 0190]
MMSLQQRLNRGLILILCVVLFLQWLASDLVISAVVEKQMTTRLTHDGDSLIDTLIPNSKNQLLFNSFHVGSVYEQAFSGHYYVIVIDKNLYYSKSLQNIPLKVKHLDAGEKNLYHLKDGPKHQPLLVLGRNFNRLGHQVSISIAEDLTNIHHDISDIRLAYLGLCLIILLLSIVLQTINVKQSLQPLKIIQKQLIDVTNGKEQQITVKKVPKEIKPLVIEINRLLLLVVRRLQQSRTAIGNLAHALKTPLAMLFRIAENPIFIEHPELQEQLLTQTSAIHRYIERELKRARISGGQQTITVFNPHQELTALIHLLKKIYAEKNLQIELKSPNELVNFDREDLLELIGNLLDNAFKWAQQRILVEISFTDNLVVAIADDGPGCKEADISLLPQRGLRLDELIKGHGLGLTIVHDIVEFYGGSLDFSRSPQLGGFLVTVILPLAQKNWT